MIVNSRVLITGGAGFIGSHLASRLIGDNEVIAVDNFRRNALQHRQKDNPKLDMMKVYEADVLDAARVAEIVREVKPTHIVHAAAIAGIDTVSKKPVLTIEIDSMGTMHMLRAALEAPDLKRIVTFSTSEIFGSNAFHAGKDTPASIGAVGEPRWTYATAKLLSEHATIAYHTQYGMPSVALRPFNVYGPGQVGEGALANFVKSALTDKSITIHGDGSQIRSWCYVDDMVDGVLLALSHDNAPGKAFNIGNPRATETILGLARTVIRLLESKSDLVFVKKDFADIELRVPDVSYPQKEIGFEPKVDLEEGLLKAAEFYRKHFGG